MTGEGLEAEEVELHQSDLLDVVHVELGDDARSSSGRLEQRHVLPQRPLGDHHPGGVHAGVAVQPLEAHGRLQQLPVFAAPLVELLEPGLLLDGLGDGRRLALDGLGHHGGHPVGVGHRHAHGPGHVADAAAGLHLVHGDDLADVVLAVFVGDVADDLVPPVHAEVDVEVGQRDALRVEEALEQQLVGDGIDVGDAQGVGHQRPRARPPPRPHRDPVLLGVVDEVLDDEKVAGEIHLLDDPQLEVQPLLVDVGVELQAQAGEGLEARLEPLLGQLGHEALGGVARRAPGTWAGRCSCRGRR